MFELDDISVAISTGVLGQAPKSKLNLTEAKVESYAQLRIEFVYIVFVKLYISFFFALCLHARMIISIVCLFGCFVLECTITRKGIQIPMGNEIFLF